MVERDQPYLETFTGNGKRRPRVAAVKHRDGILVPDEGDDRILAAVQRHVMELRNQLIFMAPARRLDAICMCTDRKTLEIVSRTMNPDDRMDRLRCHLGMDIK